jgi:outer membrane protein OmpA-like peptidoglycan-associated protein
VPTRSTIKKILFHAALVALLPLWLHAQNGSGYFNQAEMLFKNKSFYGASVLYEKYLATEKKSRPRSTPFAIEKKVKGKANVDPHQEAVYRLATCYRMINDYKKAEKYYKESIGFSDKAYPDARYWYAVTLRANQEYAEALVQITAYLEKHSQLDDKLLGADRELEDLKFIQMQSERVNDLVTLEQMKGGDSSANYALVQRLDGVVYTGIKQIKGENNEKLYTNALFESTNVDSPTLGAGNIQIPTTTGINDGMATFSKDGKKMFFTRWTKNNNQTVSFIFMSRFVNKHWTKPVKAPDPINMEGSNSAQPSLTSDGRFLLFSSDRQGGSGGYDIWAASMDSNLQPIQVHNLGNVINTAGDEEAPFLHEKSRTLVFSSNGRVGMGGFDIYYAKGNFGLNGWEKPENAGAPLNSSKDDIYFVSTDEDNIWNSGWISSDRASECCLALFSVKGNNAQYVHGNFVDCKTGKSLGNVELTVTDLRHPDRVLGKYKADTSGAYSFLLHNSAHFKISAVKPGYELSSKDYNLQVLKGVDSLWNETICLKSLSYPEKEIEKLLKSLVLSSHLGNFAYKKATLNDSAHDNLDSLAAVLKKFPDMVVQVEGYTDGIGSVKYNLILAQKRVNTCIRYLVKRGVNPKQLKGKAMGKCCPIAPDMIDGKDNPAGRKLNRRVEYKVLKH